MSEAQSMQYYEANLSDFRTTLESSIASFNDHHDRTAQAARRMRCA